MVNLAFQGLSVTKAAGSADLTAFPTVARYSVDDAHVFTFIVKNKQAKIESIAGANNSLLWQYNFYTLSLHIPPSEITFTFNKELTRTKVRGGWVIERWGDSLTSIEGSGKTGIFFNGTEGLTRVDAYKTHAYAELMELFQIYKNNGMSYNPNHGTIDTISEVILQYEGRIYRGSFDAFTYSESADSPYNFNYSFVFVSRGDSDTRISGHYVDIKQGQAVLESNETDAYLNSLLGQRIQDALVGIKAQTEALLSDPRVGKKTDEQIIKQAVNFVNARANEDLTTKIQREVKEEAVKAANATNQVLQKVGAKLAPLAENWIGPFQRLTKGAQAPVKRPSPTDRTATHKSNKREEEELPPAPVLPPPP